MRLTRPVSPPIAALVRHGLVGQAVLDYGCGDGRDVAALRAAGVTAHGWDPATAPTGPRAPADAVSVGYVVNSIEDPVERRRTLAAAWDLTRKVLAVAVPLAGHSAHARFHADPDAHQGFDKQFTSQELDTLVSGVTGRQPIVVAPGVVLVFRRDDDEQTFLRNRVTGGKALDKDDLLVYLALQVFERRRSFASVPAALATEIAQWFGSESAALDAARVLLFSAGNADLVASACDQVAQSRLGHSEHGDGLYFTTRQLTQVPSVLRVFVGCGEQLYGDACACQVVKIHDRSGKLTFHVYDEFWGQPVPKLVERAKVDLRRQRVDFFAYDGQPHDPQPLYFKSKWLTEGDPMLDDQRAFDTALAAVPGIDWTGFGPETVQLTAILRGRGLRIDGFALVSAAK